MDGQTHSWLLQHAEQLAEQLTNLLKKSPRHVERLKHLRHVERLKHLRHVERLKHLRSLSNSLLRKEIPSGISN